MEFICIWSDGTWCYQEEVQEMNHMSDDYYIVDVFDIEDIDSFVDEFTKTYY